MSGKRIRNQRQSRNPMSSPYPVVARAVSIERMAATIARDPPRIEVNRLSARRGCMYILVFVQKNCLAVDLSKKGQASWKTSGERVCRRALIAQFGSLSPGHQFMGGCS